MLDNYDESSLNIYRNALYCTSFTVQFKNLIEILGGSLLIASEGVCYMGNITKFKKQTLERLQSGNFNKIKCI